jgi:hypothetical protein
MRAYGAMMRSFPFWSHPDFEMPVSSEYQSGLCIIDGVVIPHDLHKALADPALHMQVPVLACSCAQEGNTKLLKPNASMAEFTAALEHFVLGVQNTTQLPARAVEVITALYPPQSAEFDNDPKAAMDSMVADIRVVCGSNDNARRLVRSATSATAAANHRTDGDQQPPSIADPASVDVWHAYSDLRSTSGKHAGHCHEMSTLRNADCDEKSASGQCKPTDKNFHSNVRELVVSFVRGGEVRPPFRRLGNVSGGASAFLNGSFMINNLNANITVSQDRLKSRCDFWRSTGILSQYAWDE